jgi:5-methyltetrahydrofolate--homocysteine methyltransferase
MIIVGELINSSRKVVREAIAEQGKSAIQSLAKDQEAAGAHYIDVNAGTFDKKEEEYLKWLVENVLNAINIPCCIDSPNSHAINSALKVHQEKSVEVPMVNSISLEKSRYEDLLSIVSGSDLKVVALCMSDAGMPESADDRLRIADKLINGLVKKNVVLDNIYVDPLVQSISVNPKFGQEFCKALDLIQNEFKGVHFMCGLSNISFGLPIRKFINRMFMSMAISHGLDGAILDPLDKKMMTNITTAEALSGKDEYCINFLQAYRAGNIKVS